MDIWAVPNCGTLTNPFILPSRNTFETCSLDMYVYIYIYTYIVILHILTGLVEICNQTLKPIQVLERRRTSQSRAAATADGTATGTHPSLFHGSETWNRASFEILDPQQLRHFMLISRIIFIWLKIHPRLSVAVKIPDFLKPGVSGNGVYQCINPISG